MDANNWRRGEVFLVCRTLKCTRSLCLKQSLTKCTRVAVAIAFLGDYSSLQRACVGAIASILSLDFCEMPSPDEIVFCRLINLHFVSHSAHIITRKRRETQLKIRTSLSPFESSRKKIKTAPRDDKTKSYEKEFQIVSETKKTRQMHF